MNFYKNLFATFYCFMVNRQQYWQNTGAVKPVDPYLGSIFLMGMGQSLLIVTILSVAARYFNLPALGNQYLVFSLWIICLFLLTIVCPKDKVVDIADEFKKTQRSNITLWNIVAVLSVIIPLILFFVVINRPC